MCGRYSLATPNPAQVRARFPIGEQVTVRQRFNVAPGDQVLAVTTAKDGAPRGEELRWGFLPGWARSPAEGFKMINARSETIADKPAYRTAFERFRCLIIADGFYEWQPREHASKLPFRITAVGEPLFAFAGLWSVWHRGQPDELRTCTIVTTAANSALSAIHDRMPVILERDQEDAWLDAGTPAGVLVDLMRGLEPGRVATRPVGNAVNDARYDGPDCLLDPPPDPPVHRQAPLFT